jgi:hypothetical protein
VISGWEESKACETSFLALREKRFRMRKKEENMRVRGFFVMIGLLTMLTVASPSSADITATLGPGNGSVKNLV